MRSSNYSAFISIGALLWVFSFFGESFLLQPYSTYGIFVSPIILFIGIVMWFYYQKKKLNLVTFNDLFSAPLKLDGLTKVWVVLIVWWILLFFVISFGFGNSEAIRVAKDYCIRSDKVIARAGKIQSFGLLLSGEGTRESGHYTISVVGEKENFRVEVYLVRNSSGWEVVELTMH